MNENVSYGGQYGTATANLESQYQYNDEGKITSVTYPDTETPILVTEDQNPYIAGPTYNYSYDSMYRLSGMTDSNNNTIVSNITYNAANQLLTMNYPGASEVRGYNVLNQLTTLTAGNENLTYTYPTGTNNGKVGSMYNAVSGETVAYTYDSLNRLTNATGSIQQTVQWEQGYVFDYFGNLLQKNILGGTLQQPSTQLTVSMTNNQITSVSGLSYDANGNSSTSGMTYDAENRLATSGGLQYAYDGQNERIWSWNGALDRSSNPTGFSVSMYSPTGQKLATYQLVPQWLQNWSPQMWMQVTLVSSDQYFGGRRLAVLGQLGSAGTYFPWGEDKGSTNPQNTWSYATYWRDSGTNLDYANNRYYNNAYGRFMTPDPYVGSGNGAGDPQNPQTWNRYGYASGDPANSYDPRGLWAAPPQPMDGAWGDNCGDNWIWDASLPGPCENPDFISSGGADGGSGGINPARMAFWSVFLQIGVVGAQSGHTPALPKKGIPNCLQSLWNAVNLDYSQLLYTKPTQSTQDHIIQRHMNGTTPGTSQDTAPYFWQVMGTNILTFMFGTETYDVTRNAIDFIFTGTSQNRFVGWDATGNETWTNLLVVKTDCKTVIASYPIPSND